MAQLEQQIIKITGVEQKLASNDAIFFNIKDENNHNYKLWKNKKDGSESKAYETLKKLPNNGLGMTLSMGIELQSGEYQGKKVTYRTIKLIAPVKDEVKVIHVEEPVLGLSLEKLVTDIKHANRLQIELLTTFQAEIEKLINPFGDVSEEILEETEEETPDELRAENIPF